MRRSSVSDAPGLEKFTKVSCDRRPASISARSIKCGKQSVKLRREYRSQIKYHIPFLHAGDYSGIAEAKSHGYLGFGAVLESGTDDDGFNPLCGNRAAAEICGVAGRDSFGNGRQLAQSGRQSLGAIAQF